VSRRKISLRKEKNPPGERKVHPGGGDKEREGFTREVRGWSGAEIGCKKGKKSFEQLGAKIRDISKKKKNGRKRRYCD